jgi:hypothetical protein
MSKLNRGPERPMKGCKTFRKGRKGIKEERLEDLDGDNQGLAQMIV